MRKFFQKAAAFMQDRYGSDKLNNFILITAAVLYLINIFVRTIALILIILLLLAVALYRSLSKNITRRLYENRRFVEMYTAAGDFIKRQYMKVRDFRTHRYIRCPYCKANLRLKKRTGTQRIHCPKCGGEFKKNILF